MSNQRDSATERASDVPELHLRVHDDESTARLFDPDTPGAYILVDEYSLVHLGESV